MRSLALALIPFLVFVGAALLGMRLRSRLKERHKGPETTDLLRMATTMLVTFAALVLGLLISSAKRNYDNVEDAIYKYAAALIELDNSVHAFGPGGAALRHDLAQYTAAMIASTWTTQAPPPGDYYPKELDTARDYIPMQSAQLGDILKKVEAGIYAMPNATPTQATLRQEAIQRMNQVWDRRWNLISTSDVSFSLPFYMTLGFWLVIVFLALGLTAPFNALSFLTVALSAVSISSAFFVIVDLSSVYTGIFYVSSTPVRGALAQMLH